MPSLPASATPHPNIASPRTRSLKIVSRSRINTWSPASAIDLANAAPARPPPMTIKSYSMDHLPIRYRGSSSNGTINRHKRKFVLNQHLAETSVYEWPVWMRKPLGIFAFTNLFFEECEWQSVSESLSAGAYVGFLFPCYSTPASNGAIRRVGARVVASPVPVPCVRRRL